MKNVDPFKVIEIAKNGTEDDLFTYLSAFNLDKAKVDFETSRFHGVRKDYQKARESGIGALVESATKALGKNRDFVYYFCLFDLVLEEGNTNLIDTMLSLTKKLIEIDWFGNFDRDFVFVRIIYAGYFVKDIDLLRYYSQKMDDKNQFYVVNGVEFKNIVDL